MASEMSKEPHVHIEGLKPAEIALLKDVAEVAAELAVTKTLKTMGLDPANFLEAQADMQFLRATRKRCEGVVGKVIYGVVAIGVGATLGLLWVGFRTSLKITLPLLALAAMVTIALAHEWYPSWCCSGGDCGPLAGERVKPVVGGYMVDGRFMIPASEVRRSMDGRYHGCFPKADELKCFFAPPPGS